MYKEKERRTLQVSDLDHRIFRAYCELKSTSIHKAFAEMVAKHIPADELTALKSLIDASKTPNTQA